MYEEIAESGISGLDGIYKLLKTNNRTAALKATASLLKRRQKYLGGVNPDEIKGLTPTPRTLYCTRFLAKSTSVAKNTEFDFFRKGEGDDADNLGYASGAIDAGHTNIGKDGSIPQGELFIATGIAFEFEDGVVLGDLKALLKGQVEWIENSGTTLFPLATVKEMPQEYALNLEYQALPKASPESTVEEFDRNIRPTGRQYRFKRPLFIIRGLNSRSDEGFLRVTIPTAFTANSNTDILWTCRLYGTWFQKVGRR